MGFEASWRCIGVPSRISRVEVKILDEGTDRVAWQRTLWGTHQGDFNGFPATSRPIVWRDMVTSRFREVSLPKIG